jgi:hypothetical protein
MKKSCHVGESREFDRPAPRELSRLGAGHRSNAGAMFKKTGFLPGRLFLSAGGLPSGDVQAAGCDRLPGRDTRWNRTGRILAKKCHFCAREYPPFCRTKPCPLGSDIYSQPDVGRQDGK